MNYIPDGLVADILRRLPVSSVVRFGCACKSWYNLIRNPKFISSHFQTTQPQQQQHVVRTSSLYKSVSIALLLETGDYSQRLQFQLPRAFDFEVVGSCNGILCFFHSDDNHTQFMLFNPSIRLSFWLPNPRHPKRLFDRVFVGFGFDADSNDYKIIKFDCLSAEIYSLNSNCWRDISVPKYSRAVNTFGAFVNGALHWVVEINGENVVIAFDVKAETFRQFSLPSRLARYSVSQGELNVVEYGGTSLAFVVRSHGSINEIDILVMKEYGAIDSTEHLATIYIRWGERDGRILFIRTGSRELASYELEQGALKDLVGTLREPVPLHKYVPSLFLLHKEYNMLEPTFRRA